MSTDAILTLDAGDLHLEAQRDPLVRLHPDGEGVGLDGLAVLAWGT